MLTRRVGKVLIDWDDDGRYAHTNSDITQHIANLSYTHGTGVFNNPAEFSLVLLRGRCVLAEGRANALIDEVGDAIYRPHSLRHEINGQLSVLCTALPLVKRRAGSQFKLVSPNRGQLGETIEIAEMTSLTDSQIVHRFMLASGLQQAASWFAGVAMAAPFQYRGTVRTFLRDFAETVGGYWYENRSGHVGFISPRGRLERAGRAVDSTVNPIFEGDITLKAQEVRNQLTIPVRGANVSSGELIRSANLIFNDRGTQQITILAPRNALVANWTHSITGSGISSTLIEHTASHIVFSISASAPGTAIINVRGDVSRLVELYQINESRPESVARFGGLPYERLRPWVASLGDMVRELARRSKGVRTARITLPLTDDLSTVFWLDTGSLLSVTIEGEHINAIIGGRTVNFDKFLTFTLDCIELPLVVDSGRSWYLGRVGSSELGRTTYLGGDRARESNYLSLDGELLTLDGEYLEFDDWTENLLDLDGELLTLDGEYLELQ